MGGVPLRAGRLGGEIAVATETSRAVRAEIGGLRIEAAAQADPPHRLTRLRMYSLGQRVTDPRVVSPTSRTSGPVPAAAASVAEDSLAELGLPGLAVAGPEWTVTRGWADLDRPEVLQPGHRFPAYSVSKLVTATAVPRLVAGPHRGRQRPAAPPHHLREPAGSSWHTGCPGRCP